VYSRFTENPLDMILGDKHLISRGVMSQLVIRATLG
jgi:hypothetical protein